MKLSILDRVLLQSILPKEGDIVTIKIIRDLRTALGFDEKDVEECEISQEGNQVVWKKNIDKEINIGPKALTIIVSALEELNKDGKLSENHIAVYEKFMEDEP